MFNVLLCATFGSKYVKYCLEVLCFCTIQQIFSSDMESKTDTGSASLEELAAIEDEETLNKMVSQ